jgi:hypothetical protein
MLAYISTFPALGQVTQIDHNTSVFTALLEVDETRTADPWQLSLWHSEGSDWREVPMDQVIKPSSYPTSLQSPKLASGLHQLYFTTPLAIHLPTNFTIKFRNGPGQSWKWVKDHQGTADGVVMLKTVTSKDAISSKLEDYVENLNPILQAKNHMSQSPGTTIWSVEASIDPADGENSNTKDIKFGTPWGSGKFSRYEMFFSSQCNKFFEESRLLRKIFYTPTNVDRWFALVRIWTPWLAPRQGKDFFGLDKEAVMCSFLSRTGKHLVLLGISGIDDIMTLFTSVDGAVNLHV